MDPACDEGRIDPGRAGARDIVLERVADRQQAGGGHLHELETGPVDPRMRLAMIMHRAAHLLIGECDEARSLAQPAIGMDAVAVRIAADHRQAACSASTSTGRQPETDCRSESMLITKRKSARSRCVPSVRPSPSARCSSPGRASSRQRLPRFAIRRLGALRQRIARIVPGRGDMVVEMACEPHPGEDRLVVAAAPARIGQDDHSLARRAQTFEAGDRAGIGPGAVMRTFIGRAGSRHSGLPARPCRREMRSSPAAQTMRERT
ncbi:hypothetical protein BTHI11S_03292 [Bosea thiooxidans]